MSILYIIGFVVYFLAMGWIILGCTRLPIFSSEGTIDTLNKSANRTRFSIVVPFRNEAENLPDLLKTITTLDYPRALFEVLFVNDASEDDGEQIIINYLKNHVNTVVSTHQETVAGHGNLQYKILQNKRTSRAPKKDAIREAIEQASYEWILTTDADCSLPTLWLESYNDFIQQKKPKMVCGPIRYHEGSSLLAHFQVMDGLSLQAVAMGGFGWNRPLLCNGANLGYEKAAFHSVSGFDGNDHIASGDDIFLMEKIKEKFPKHVYFLKSNKAIVTTKGVENVKQLMAQRIRWASKTTQQQNSRTKLLGAIVFVTNILFFLAVISLSDYRNTGYRIYLGFILLKILLDYVVLAYMSHFYKTNFSWLRYLINAFMYPVVSIGAVIGSSTGTYKWKGRDYKK